jgi:hypothetical protein
MSGRPLNIGQQPIVLKIGYMLFRLFFFVPYPYDYKYPRKPATMAIYTCPTNAEGKPGFEAPGVNERERMPHCDFSMVVSLGSESREDLHPFATRLSSHSVQRSNHMERE